MTKGQLVTALNKITNTWPTKVNSIAVVIGDDIGTYEIKEVHYDIDQNAIVIECGANLYSTQSQGTDDAA